MSRTVKAAVAFAANEPLRICEVELADPKAHEVLVRFIATGLCHTDAHVLDGSIPQAFPVILGHEGIAEVVEVGEGVTDFAPGDRVIPYLVPDCGTCAFCTSGRTNLCVQFRARRMAGATPFTCEGLPVSQFMGIGSFAEMSVVAADQLTKVSKAAAPDLACCIACGVTTGLGAVQITAGVEAGASVAVFGTGGVGLSVVQGAALSGATTIIAIDIAEAKREPAMAAGATHFINARDVDAVAEVHRLTGLGADFAFECVGQTALAVQALEATNPAWGVGVCVGVMPAGAKLSVEPTSLVMGRRWTGSFMGGAKRADVARYVEMLASGELQLDHLVSHRLTFDEINRGFDMMKTGEAIRSVVLF